jgi:hypothetical protein
MAADLSAASANWSLLDQSGQRWVFVREILSANDPKRAADPHDSGLRCRPPKYTGLLLRRELRRRVLEHDIDLHRFGRDQEAVVSPLLANSGFDRRLTQRPFLDVVRMSATGDIP